MAGRSKDTFDYSKLESLLAVGNWRAANVATTQKMLQIANAPNTDWLQPYMVHNFPVQDLQEIDRLWCKYSQSHFGFSIQRDIYCHLGGSTSIYVDDIWNRFGDAVGWRRYHKNGSLWLSHEEDLIFDRQRAPKGHLPRGYTASNSWVVQAGYPLGLLFERL